MVEAMQTDGGMVDVVSETDDERITFGDGRQLDDGKAGSEDPSPQQRDMALEGRDGCVGSWLAGCDECPNLSEEVIANAYDGLAVHTRHRRDRLLRVLE